MTTPLEPASDQADYEKAMDEVHAKVSRLHLEHQERLPMWVVFGPGTTDHPGMYLARLWFMRPEQVLTNVLIRAMSLEEIHELLPPGLHLLPRYANDDPNIIQVFI